MPVVARRGVGARIARGIFGVLQAAARPFAAAAFAEVKHRDFMRGLPRSERRRMWRDSWLKFRVAG